MPHTNDENKQDSRHTTPTQELRRFEEPLPLNEDARTTLLRHNCTLEEHPGGYIIHFPPGTTRIRTIVTMSEHYRITLPDGYQLLGAYDWHRVIRMLWYTCEQ